MRRGASLCDQALPIPEAQASEIAQTRVGPGGKRLDHVLDQRHEVLREGSDRHRLLDRRRLSGREAVLAVGERRPEVGHRLGIGSQRLGESLLFGRGKPRHIEQLRQGRVSDEVGLREEAAGVQSLQSGDELRDLARELRSDQASGNG
jgi:hypothetical protein